MGKIYLKESSVITLVEDVVTTYQQNYGTPMLYEAGKSTMAKRLAKRAGKGFENAAGNILEKGVGALVYILAIALVVFIIWLVCRSCTSDHSVSVDLSDGGGSDSGTVDLIDLTK